MSPLEFLLRSPWAPLPRECLEAIASALEPVHFSKGKVIINQGAPGGYLYFLVSGEVEARVRTPAGVVATVAGLREGDCFGEMSLLTGDTASADVVAVTDVEVLGLHRTAFDSLVADNPHLIREFVRVISRRLRMTDASVGTAAEKEQELTRFIRDDQSDRYREFIGKHPGVKALRQQIEEHGRSETPLLIQGERGTGKELAARLVHTNSARRDGPLLSVDCARVVETSKGDSLFGGLHGDDVGSSYAHGVCHMDLADGGTILLTNVPALPAGVEQRLLRFLASQVSASEETRRNVRVIVTCQQTLSEWAAAGRILPELAAILSQAVITLPPLRERKRDIPELAEHLVRKHATRLGKPVRGLSDPALIKLVSHDYLYANVAELEEAIERAAILVDGELVEAETIVLGAPPEEHLPGLNLLSLPAPIVSLGLRLFPVGVQALAGIIFAFIVFLCLFGSAQPAENIGLPLVWSIWWPMLILSFFFAGRAWCAVCPMAMCAGFLQRWVNLKRRVPAWMQKNDHWLTMAGFLAIVWVEEATGMRHSPRATGALLLAILAGAVVTGILLQRRAWCRYLCPLGGLAGVCSTSALVELRPVVDVCSAKCRDHSCYKGDDRVPGCPMFNHVMFVDTNRFCVMCLNCVRVCPNGSPQLNIRPPARELWAHRNARPEVSRFGMLLAGIVVAIILLQRWEAGPDGWVHSLLSQHRMAFVTAVLGLGAGLPLLVFWGLERRLVQAHNPEASTRFWQQASTWVPLAAAGFASYQLGFIPGLASLTMVFAQQQSGNTLALVQCPVLPLLRFLFLFGGVTVAAGIAWQCWKERGVGGHGHWATTLVLGLAGIFVYWLMVEHLLLQPLRGSH